MPTSFTDPGAGDTILDSHIDQFIVPINAIENGSFNWALDTSSNDDYTSTVTPTPPTLNSSAKGYNIYFSPTHNNVGPCTLALNGGSAASIKMPDGGDPGSDVLVAGGIYNLVWDGTQWQVTSGSFDTPTTAQNAADITFDDTGLHISAIDVQAMGEALDGYAYAHISDTTDAHAASAISVDDTDFGQLVGTDLQTVLDYIDDNMGSGSGYIPDEPPVSPNAADDEFDTGSSIDTAGTRFSGATAWTWVNQGSTTANVASGILTLSGGENSNHRMVTQPVSGTWKYRCKVLHAMHSIIGSDYVSGGMCVRASDGKLLVFAYYMRETDCGFNFQRYSDPATFSANVKQLSTNSMFAPPMYFEVEFDGTDIIARMSRDGLNFSKFSSDPAASYVTPDKIGLFVNSSHATSPAVISFDWFRRIS